LGLIILNLLKENDDHPFRQYQQNEQSPLILIELTEHQKGHDVGNPGHGL
jgi:hypothetical protein